ncbi:GTPase domain-containing protein [Myxococcota bacterium]|nr:GTPase domain-containing protein [Myxococcota bacterium]
MALSSSPAGTVKAQVVYWGAEKSGKRSSLRAVHEKLRADHRGPLRTVPTRLDPTTLYETFSIQIGQIAGASTHLEVIAVPGGPGLETTRKQLLDQVDGIILVLDAQADRLEQNLASVAELRESLASYGQTLEQLPVVIQYNKRDLGEPFSIEALHRRVGLPEAAVFETVATEHSGVLQVLTTLSKRVVRILRETAQEAASTPSTGQSADPFEPDQAVRDALEAGILDPGTEDETGDLMMQSTRLALEDNWPAPEDPEKEEMPSRSASEGLKILSVGIAQTVGNLGLRVPLVLEDQQGNSTRLALNISLEPLLDEDL